MLKVTTNYEKLHQDNTRSTEKYLILWDVVKRYKILEIVVISIARDNQLLANQNVYTKPQNACILGAFFICLTTG